MKKLNMPILAGLQNFVFLTDGSVMALWSTKSLKDKIKGLFNKKKVKPFCYTSLGYKVDGHQQFYWDNGFLIHDDGKTRVYYNEMTGGLVKQEAGIAHSWRDIYKLENTPPYDVNSPNHVFNQGIDYDDHTYTIWSNRGKGNITIKKHKDNKLIKEKTIKFNHYKKWYFKGWEAEGIRIRNQKIYIGISFDTILHTRTNYIEEIQL